MNIAVFSPLTHKGRLIQQYLRAFRCDIFSAVSEFTHPEQYVLSIIDLAYSAEETASIVQFLMSHQRPILFIASAKQIELITQYKQTPKSDYLINPIQRLDITTRVTVLLETHTDNYSTERSFSLENYQFDRQNHIVSFNHQQVLLTQKEFAVAQLLLSHLDQPLSRAYIQDAVWGKTAEISGRTIDTHISRVRNKLMLIPEHGYLLTSIYSFGYQLEKTQIKQ